MKIEVTTAAHAAAKQHCKAHSITVKAWVSRLILTRTDDRKQLEAIPRAKSDDALWSRPPFWSKSRTERNER